MAWTRPASRCPGGAARCADRHAARPRRPSPGSVAARRARPGVAGRSSGCSCGSRRYAGRRCSPAASRWPEAAPAPRRHSLACSWLHLASLCGLPRGGFVPRVVTDHARHEHARLDRNRLVDHALLLGVVTHLDISDQREILAERVADETVVGEDATQVRMALEHDAVEVERLALEP